MLEEGQDVSFYTRSGRRYDAPNTKVEPVKRKSLMIEQRKEKPELPVNESVTEKEAKEFLKFLKHSEYSVVKQLHKQPAHISVLALLLSSETYCSALMKLLNETYVADDISVNKLDRLGNNINADNFIFFNDDEIPPGGMLPVGNYHMKTCQNIVRVFDGTERKVLGKIEIPLLIGPNIYEVDFLVMDIKPSYNCLLERLWIHSAGAVPSSLHQKLKLVTEGRLIMINTGEDIITSVTSDVPYIESDSGAIECSFRSLKFVNVTFIIEGSKIPMPKISKATRMSLQLTVGKRALPGRGLGKYLHGRVEVPILTDKLNRFSLGYKPDVKQRKKKLEKKTFVSGGIIHLERKMTRKEIAEDMMGNLNINAIFEEGMVEENLSGIRPYEPGSVLNNWTTEEIPIVFRVDSESPDINDMSDAATDPESPFERNMCLEGFQDFEDDRDCNLSPDLLRMVE
ncbi:hypothetical protein EPI10_028943 [Gossypium australe]|uniref:Gag-pro-like protein n=1 Tax=Gossypium australe TaxID=47621 RepID=A0A5B6UYK8_9ROSI|nr:hypothetical protein EPI10_028943 [Gossypium australe]